MTTDQDSFGAALRQQFHDDGEPADAGFSLRVMAALPPRVPPRRQRAARWVRYANWAAASWAATGASVLLSGVNGPPDAPHALAGLVMLGLLAFWAIPSRWSRG